MTEFIRISGLSKRFAGLRALDNIDLDILAGEVHCLAGENGSGKSTLIKIISGLQAPERGASIRISGVEYQSLNPQLSTSLGIQVIYQDLSLFPNLSVAENIAVGRHLGRPHLVSWAEIKERALGAMKRVDVRLPLDAMVGDLSIASRQLVSICRALAADARLVIMDEPTASLTHGEVNGLLRAIETLKRDGISVVFVSHKLGEVLQVSDRVTVLRDGSKVGTFSVAGMTNQQLGYLMTGKEFTYERRSFDNPNAPIVLSVSNLSKERQYGDVSFDLRAGEILGITGPLGAGRTELALSLFGMNRPDAGDVEVKQKRLSLQSNRDSIRHGIAYVSEDRLSLGLIQEQSISANVVVTKLSELSDVFGILSPRKIRATVKRWLKDLAIKAGAPENAVNTLSGGNQQRVVLAKWLARDPIVLILDSPTVGVDINAKDGIYDIIEKLAERGVGIVLISDEVSEVLYHSHSVAVMNRGRLSEPVKSTSITEVELEELVHG